MQIFVTLREILMAVQITLKFCMITSCHILHISWKLKSMWTKSQRTFQSKFFPIVKMSLVENGKNKWKGCKEEPMDVLLYSTICSEGHLVICSATHFDNAPFFISVIIQTNYHIFSRLFNCATIYTSTLISRFYGF